MTDHIIPLPSNWQYVNQFAPSQWAPTPSLYRCVTATMAMLGEVAYPGRWNPPQLEDQLYTRFAGPDLPTDQQGLTKANVLKWFDEVGIGYIDLAALIGGDMEALRLEIAAQNLQGVPQFLTVADESKLYEYGTNKKLHNWVDVGLSHCFMRVGFSDSEHYGLYEEPAAPAFAHPVKIDWANIVEAGIITAIAVCPHGVPVPPAGFRYTNGTWPAPPKPPFDAAKAESTLAAAMLALDAARGALTNVTNDLAALKGEV